MMMIKHQCMERSFEFPARANNLGVVSHLHAQTPHQKGVRSA